MLPSPCTPSFPPRTPLRTPDRGSNIGAPRRYTASSQRERCRRYPRLYALRLIERVRGGPTRIGVVTAPSGCCIDPLFAPARGSSPLLVPLLL
eukprot:363227-Chlamydomonas_euryale.AAC.10